MEGPRMLVIVTILLGSAVSAMSLPLAVQQWKSFRLQPNPTMGPHRLSVGWTDRSLMSCVASCMTRYPQTCQSVMYNHTTQLCTPGGWQSLTERLPSAEEGQLYATCPTDLGFELHFNNGVTRCLFNSTTSLNYREARAACQNMDSYLYTVKSQDKLALLQSLHPGLIWVGLDDLVEEGKFIWVDDDTEIDVILKSNILDLTQPQDPSYDCVVMSSGGLSDVKCDLHLGFICEKDLV